MHVSWLQVGGLPEILRGPGSWCARPAWWESGDPVDALKFQISPPHLHEHAPECSVSGTNSMPFSFRGRTARTIFERRRRFLNPTLRERQSAAFGQAAGRLGLVERRPPFSAAMVSSPGIQIPGPVVTVFNPWSDVTFSPGIFSGQFRRIPNERGTTGHGHGKHRIQPS